MATSDVLGSSEAGLVANSVDNADPVARDNRSEVCLLLIVGEPFSEEQKSLIRDSIAAGRHKHYRFNFVNTTFWR